MRPSIPSKLRALLHPQIPLTCGPHILTFSTQQVHLPSRFLIVCKIPYPYGIYHTPYFVASTSAPELCQPHQTDTCAHPTRFVPSGTTSRRGALYVYVPNSHFCTFACPARPSLSVCDSHDRCLCVCSGACACVRLFRTLQQ